MGFHLISCIGLGPDNENENKKKGKNARPRLVKDAVSDFWPQTLNKSL